MIFLAILLAAMVCLQLVLNLPTGWDRESKYIRDEIN